MSYFSRFAEKLYCKDDYSYPSPEMQLVFRIADLQSMLCNLSTVNRPSDKSQRLSDEDLRYVPVGQLRSTADIKKAIGLAVSDLRSKYNAFEIAEVNTSPSALTKSTSPLKVA